MVAVAGGYAPPFSEMVVDANSGKTLDAVNENDLRHPASITKVMTLYMLFEQLERGKMTLESEIPVSAHAASMEPSKLGLRAGSTITVENAIKAIVTKSANDMAVAVAEAIGGSEDRFSEMMTEKAHALGMSRTHYANASGLPDPEQLTTAHDLITLARAMYDRFPRFYAYFSLPAFNFHGQTIRNHNHLLGRVEGMDGIKTGYTHASGSNLLTSVKRGNRRIFAVILGGRSAAARDHLMAGLIEDNITGGSPVRVASAASDVEDVRGEAREAEARHEAPVVKAEPPKPTPAVAAYAAPVVERPRPAVVASITHQAADDPTASIPRHKTVALDGSTRFVTANVATVTTSGLMRWVAGPAARNAAASKAAANETRLAKAEPARDVHAAKSDLGRPAMAKTGLMIQIGATDEADKAHDLLARAKSQHPALARATPFTEKVQKGSETLYRARFAGLTESQADDACKSLKRSGFACFATKN